MKGDRSSVQGGAARQPESAPVELCEGGGAVGDGLRERIAGEDEKAVTRPGHGHEKLAPVQELPGLAVGVGAHPVRVDEPCAGVGADEHDDLELQALGVFEGTSAHALGVRVTAQVGYAGGCQVGGSDDSFAAFLGHATCPAQDGDVGGVSLGTDLAEEFCEQRVGLSGAADEMQFGLGAQVAGRGKVRFGIGLFTFEVADALRAEDQSGGVGDALRVAPVGAEDKGAPADVKASGAQRETAGVCNGP